MSSDCLGLSFSVFLLTVDWLLESGFVGNWRSRVRTREVRSSTFCFNCSFSDFTSLCLTKSEAKVNLISFI